MTPFSLILILLTHYFHKILDPIGSKFVSRAEPGYRIFDAAKWISVLMLYKLMYMIQVGKSQVWW